MFVEFLIKKFLQNWSARTGFTPMDHAFVAIKVFYLGFLSRTFTTERAAVEGGGYLFDSSLPLPPTSQTLRR